MADQIIVSRNETERIEKLGVYFRTYLHDWLSGVIVGTRYSDGLAAELARALLECAAAAVIGSSGAARDESDEATGERIAMAARDMFAVLEREIHS